MQCSTVISLGAAEAEETKLMPMLALLHPEVLYLRRDKGMITARNVMAIIKLFIHIQIPHPVRANNTGLCYSIIMLFWYMA